MWCISLDARLLAEITEVSRRDAQNGPGNVTFSGPVRWVDQMRPSSLTASRSSAASDVYKRQVQGLDIDDFSRAKIDASAKELADERDAVKELGLI